MGHAEDEARLNDKVRITNGPHAGQRGTIKAFALGSVSIRLRDSGHVVSIEPSRIVNFSAAARKAWQTMPSRRVGRPKGHTTDRISVTLRVDRVMWFRFKSLERQGLIQERSTFLETVIAKELLRLEANKK